MLKKKTTKKKTSQNLNQLTGDSIELKSAWIFSTLNYSIQPQKSNNRNFHNQRQVKSGSSFNSSSAMVKLSNPIKFQYTGISIDITTCLSRLCCENYMRKVYERNLTQCLKFKILNKCSIVSIIISILKSTLPLVLTKNLDYLIELNSNIFFQVSSPSFLLILLSHRRNATFLRNASILLSSFSFSTNTVCVQNCCKLSVLYSKCSTTSFYCLAFYH